MASFHFKLDGGDFTELARSIYADDQEPGKAVALLEAAFPKMRPAIRLAILTGSKRLVGDESGMDLVDDDAEVTRNGMPLDLAEATAQLRKEKEENYEAIRDAAEIQTRDLQLVATPKGGMMVPAHRAQQIRSGKVRWDEVYHEPMAPLSDFKMTGRYPGPEGPLEKPAPVPLPPVEPQDQITCDNGWLDPEGRFYPGQYGEHLHILSTLGIQEEEAHRRGWIKIATSMSPELSDLPGRNVSIFSRQFGRPTQAQVDRVFSRFNFLPEWMKQD